MTTVGRGTAWLPIERFIKWLRHQIGKSRPRRAIDSSIRFARPKLSLTFRDQKTCVFVYDLKVSPLTNGDFLLFALVARLYQVSGVRTVTVVLDDALREDSHDIPASAAERIATYREITAAVSLPNMSEFTQMSFSHYLAWKDNFKTAAFYGKKRERDERSQIYGWSWGVLEYALRLVARRHCDRFLLTGPEIAGNLGLDLPKRYVALAVRAASQYREDFDVAIDEYSRQLEMIRCWLPSHSIYVFSDAAGTSAIKSWGINDGGVKFSQDFGDSFISNLTLALGSDCYVQLKGGGLAAGVSFSTLPYWIASLHGHLPQYPSYTVGEEYDHDHHPAWSHPLSLWRAPNEESWASLDRFLAKVAKAKVGS